MNMIVRLINHAILINAVTFSLIEFQTYLKHLDSTHWISGFVSLDDMNLRD